MARQGVISGDCWCDHSVEIMIFTLILRDKSDIMKIGLRLRYIGSNASRTSNVDGLELDLDTHIQVKKNINFSSISNEVPTALYLSSSSHLSSPPLLAVCLSSLHCSLPPNLHLYFPQLSPPSSILSTPLPSHYSPLPSPLTTLCKHLINGREVRFLGVPEDVEAHQRQPAHTHIHCRS
jgi:hypothetical protein